MKDYALKINGHNYDVRIDDVNESSTLAHVVVNGTAYEVEIAGAKGAATKRPQVAPAPREADSAKITPATAAPAPRIAPVAPSTGYTIKCPLPGTVLSINVKVGDTITAIANPCKEAIAGFEDVKPMVFAGLYPVETDQYEDLRASLEKLNLNDASLTYEPESSLALGFGFRCGFLGLLHMEIIQERVSRVQYGRHHDRAERVVQGAYQ